MAQTVENSSQAVTVTKGRAGKYLTFSLGTEIYGLPVLKVKEILGMMPTNTVPQAPPSIRGIINLRDKVIPVLDLRRRFDMPQAEDTTKTCIVVVEGQRVNLHTCWVAKGCDKENCPAHQSADHRCWMISGTFCRNEIQGSYHEKINACRKCDFYQEMQKRRLVFLMGIVVDTVQEVATFKEEEIEDAPPMSDDIDLDYIRGVSKRDGAVTILLDVDKILQGHVV